MPDKPLDPKATEGGKKAEPAHKTPTGPSGGAVKPKQDAKPSAPKGAAKGVVKKKPESKSKSRVSPDEVKRLKVAILLKLSKAPQGLRTVDLAKQLNISTSKLTFVASDLLKKGEIKKAEINERVVYMSKDAKLETPEEQREKLYSEIEKLLGAAPKGLKISDIATKTKKTPQKVVAAMRPHIDKKEVQKVGDEYRLTGKKAEPAKKPAPEIKKPEKKEPPKPPTMPKTPPKPPIQPDYRRPHKQSRGAGVAWFALLIALLSGVLWVSLWGKTSELTTAVTKMDSKIETRLISINALESRLNARVDDKFKAADRMILNTYFNGEVIKLKGTLLELDGLAGMTDNPETRARVAEAKQAVQKLINTLLSEYRQSVER